MTPTPDATPPAPPRRLALRLEQTRQARRIHGGLVPLGLAVAAVKLARLPIPFPGLRRRLFRDVYAKRYPPGLNEAESARPLESYRSLNAVFTRGLKPECRPIPATLDVLSPCDGTVQDVGRVEGGKVFTVKEVGYSLASLMPGADVAPFEGGAFAILFLSPIDCHRVFSPVEGTVGAMTHVPGARLLVHPPFQRPEFPVYTLNERVVFRLETGRGPCAVVMVAGWGVGHITSPLAPGFRPGSRRARSYAWGRPPEVRRGEWLATFELGSSVVLIAAASLGAAPVVSPNEKVRYGQPVLGIAPPAPA